MDLDSKENCLDDRIVKEGGDEHVLVKVLMIIVNLELKKNDYLTLNLADKQNPVRNRLIS